MDRFLYANPLPLGAALVAAVALATPAQAADPVSSPYSAWAGFYAGAVYGAGLSLDRSSQTATRSVSGWGQTSGAVIGYDFQSGRYVYGLEGDFSYHLLRPTNGGVTGGLSPNVDDTPETERLRARFGYDLGAFLPFVDAGLATARIYQAGYPSPAVQWGQTQEATGVTLGAGLEWRFDAPYIGPLVLRGEYILDVLPTQSFAVYPGQAPIRTQNTEQFFRLGLISYMNPSWRPGASASGNFDWSGAYAGVLGGGLWAQPKTTSAGSPSTTTSASGPAAGIFTGRNFTFGALVAGYEGALEATDVTGSGPQPNIADATFRNYFEAEARLRAGYAFGRFLPYVTAGLDWGRAEETDPATGSYRGRIPSDSATFGGGLEYGFSDRWSARVEYLYAVPTSTEWTRLDTATLVLDQTRPSQTLRAGLAYYFH
ncbi:MAG: porin family protein [Bradyrhizobium sp.]|nr:MAG: porin family protein [Bradyrhizobium sp.]